MGCDMFTKKTLKNVIGCLCDGYLEEIELVVSLDELIDLCGVTGKCYTPNSNLDVMFGNIKIENWLDTYIAPKDRIENICVKCMKDLKKDNIGFSHTSKVWSYDRSK